MPRCYTVRLDPTAIAVATTDLIELVAADDVPIGVRAIRVFQVSDFGDAQDEVVRIAVVRGNTASGSGGSAFTPLKKKPRDPAATFTAEVGNTTAANTGTTEQVYTNGFNVRAGLDVIIPESDMAFTDQANNFLVLRLPAAPADSLTIGVEIDVWEMP